MTSIPPLTTARLIPRGFEARDFDAYAAMMADPDVTRHLGDGRPLERADAWRQRAMLVGHWALRGFGIWAVEERAERPMIAAVHGGRERGAVDSPEVTRSSIRRRWNRNRRSLIRGADGSWALLDAMSEIGSRAD